MCGAGHCCEEVAVSMFQGPGRQAQYLAFATELALPAKHRENTSFAYNYCVNRPILKILTALERVHLVPKFVRLSWYCITYMLRGTVAKQLRYIVRF